MKTSRSRQLALSCTYRQSLLNRRIVQGLKGTPRLSHTSCASRGSPLPLKMVISRMARPPVGEQETPSFRNKIKIVTMPVLVRINNIRGRVHRDGNISLQLRYLYSYHLS